MRYKITSIRRVEDAIETDVDYDIDGVAVSVTVQHFHPQSLAEVKQNIINRGLTEKVKLDAIDKCNQIIPQVTVGQVVNVP